jgi:hypothetical protein
MGSERVTTEHVREMLATQVDLRDDGAVLPRGAPVSDPTFADAILQIQHLTATVADLTRRLEAAEREIATLHPPPSGWDAAVNWSATDGSLRYVCGNSDGTFGYGIPSASIWVSGLSAPYAAAAACDAARSPA